MDRKAHRAWNHAILSAMQIAENRRKFWHRLSNRAAKKGHVKDAMYWRSAREACWLVQVEIAALTLPKPATPNTTTNDKGGNHHDAGRG